MIVILFIYLVRRYKAVRKPLEYLKKINFRLRLPANLPIVLLLTSFCFSCTVYTQVKILEYKVIRNGDVIGHINFRQLVLGCSTTIKVESEVKARFIMPLKIKTNEETVYRNGILVFSSLYRQFNGSERTNLQTRLVDSSYELNNKGRIGIFKNYPIRLNLQSMYIMEPTGINKAYADNFSKFVPVEKTGTNKYKITLPDGNYNYYYYEDGVCLKVEVHNTLYTLEFLLTKKK